MTYKRAIFIYLLVALFLCFEMAVQVSPGIMTVQLIRDLNINAFELGLMSGFYFYTYTVMQIPAGLLFDKFNIRLMIVAPLLICVLGVFLFGRAEGIVLASCARLLMGLGSAFAFIAVLVVALDLFRERHFALLAGLTQMLAALGAMGGELPLNKLVEAIGWRNTMNCLALAGLLLAILIWLFAKYDKIIPLKKQHNYKIFQQLKIILIKPQTWLVAIYACLLWMPMTAFASLWGIPFLVKTYNISNSAATSSISFMWLGLAIISPILGFWSDYIKRRTLPLALVSIVGLLSFTALLYSHNFSLIGISVLLFLCGGTCAGQALSFAVVQDITQRDCKATAIGFNNMAVVISGAISQPLTGKLIQMHWNGTMLDNKPFYLAEDYRFALFVILIGFTIATCINLFFIKETYCRNTLESKTFDSSNHL